MENPNVDRIYETFIRISDKSIEAHIKLLRGRVIPLIRKLQEGGLISWYSFLVHDWKCIPTRKYDKNSYFQLRMELTEGREPKELETELPDDFIADEEGSKKIRKMSNPQIDPKIDVTKLREGTAEAWRIAGEGSEWILRTLEAYSDESEIPIEQIARFFHYIDNGLGGLCRFFRA